MLLVMESIYGCTLWCYFSLQATLDVLFEPEFDASKEYKAGPGDLAKVVVKVRASPDPDVFWAKKDAEGKVEKIEKKDKKWERSVKNNCKKNRGGINNYPPQV